MIKKRFTILYCLICTIAVVTLLTPSHAAEKPYMVPLTIGNKAPDFALWGSAGGRHKLGKYLGSIIIMEWIDHNCPYTRQLYDSGKIQDIQQLFVVRNDVLWGSMVSVAEDNENFMQPEELWERTKKDRAYPSTVLLDKKLNAARVYGVNKVGTFIIIDQEGYIRYKGALESNDGNVNYVTQAVENILLEDEVEIPETEVKGCDIEF